jgi:hypothetical protein
MLIRLFIAILTLFLCVITLRADKPIVIKDSEAIQHVGKLAEVRGISRYCGPGHNVARERLIRVFSSEIDKCRPKWGWLLQRLTLIQGKTISITGTIRLRDGKPEIEILSADQIKVLDSQTER